MRVRSLVCGAEVVLSFYNRVCGLDSRFYFSESSVNANGYRVSIVQKRRENCCHKDGLSSNARSMN